jgi:hypothetical protein
VLLETGPWTFGWEALVAIGTIALASGTVYLAWATRGVAEATNAELAADWRPVMLVRTLNERTDQPRADCRLEPERIDVSCRNVGRGPALNCHAKLVSYPGGESINKGVAIPHGESETFRWRPPPDETYNPFDSITFVIHYADLAGQAHQTVSIIHIDKKRKVPVISFQRVEQPVRRKPRRRRIIPRLSWRH